MSQKRHPLRVLSWLQRMTTENHIMRVATWDRDGHSAWREDEGLFFGPSMTSLLFLLVFLLRFIFFFLLYSFCLCSLELHVMKDKRETETGNHKRIISGARSERRLTSLVSLVRMKLQNAFSMTWTFLSFVMRDVKSHLTATVEKVVHCHWMNMVSTVFSLWLQIASLSLLHPWMSKGVQERKQ